MFVNNFILLSVSNPFFQAYFHSDFLGKVIFISLIVTSICCWTILIHKILLTQQVKKQSDQFQKAFLKKKGNLLQLENEKNIPKTGINPFFELFHVLKKHTVDILNKNHRFGDQKEGTSYLSTSDIDYIEAHLASTVASQTKYLEKYLFILSTIVGLAPLLGLLGTVWGILTTFSQLQTHALGSTNQMVIGGISLALTTTVLGLLNAIPALIGYNYLKNTIRNYEISMDSFANEMLSSIEMQYRKVDFSK